MAQLQFVHLCHAITTVERNRDQEDRFTWTCTATGQYSARAIYASLCSGLPRSPMGACVWRSWAPLKCIGWRCSIGSGQLTAAHDMACGVSHQFATRVCKMRTTVITFCRHADMRARFGSSFGTRSASTCRTVYLMILRLNGG